MKALELQNYMKSEVIVFHSVEHRVDEAAGMGMISSFGVGEPYVIPEPDVARLREVYVKNAQAIIDRAKDIFMEQGIEIKARLIYDEGPVSYIKKAVKEENIDLVIIGTKGTHSLYEEILLGSVAEKVLRHVPADILIIR